MFTQREVARHMLCCVHGTITSTKGMLHSFLSTFESHEKCESVSGSVSVCGKNFNVAIASDAMTMINV